MKKKKCGACRAPALRLERGDFGRMLISFGVLLAVALIIRLMTGNPYRAISYGNLGGIFPSVFTLTLLRILSFAALGASFGLIFGRRVCRDEISKYKGGMLFVLMLTLYYLWYPVFFGAMAFFLALLLTEATLALAFLCALLFMRVRRIAGWIMLGYGCFILYMTVIGIMALFAA